VYEEIDAGLVITADGTRIEPSEPLNQRAEKHSIRAKSPIEAAMVAFDVLLSEAKQRTPRIRRLAEKIEADLVKLRDLVSADTEAAAARKEIADLEARLAVAKAKIGRSPKHRIEPEDGEYDCPDCDRTFSRNQGLGAHRAHKHGYRRKVA
jgi:hypothetical protein